jgi:ketosteroid isomerase-like protein
MNAKFANKFAADWISAWNNADLSRVLAHYTEDFEMSSPYIQTVFEEPSGTLTGKERVRAYWQMMLSKFGTPKMELVNVFTGAGSVAIEYRNRGRKGVEIFFFDESGLVSRAAAHYLDEDVACEPAPVPGR